MEGPNLKHHLSPPESGRLRLLLKMCCVQFSPSKYLCGPSLGHAFFRVHVRNVDKFMCKRWASVRQALGKL